MLMTVFAFVAFMPSQAYAASPLGATRGVVRVKLQPEVAQTVAKAPRLKAKSGKVVSGVETLDHALNLISGVNIRPMLPPNPKFAAQRAKYGLDQWYVVTFDEALAPESIVKSLKEVAGIEKAEVIKPMELKDGTGGYRVVSAPQRAQSSDLPFNDPRLSEQWHYRNLGDKNLRVAGADINLFEAWQLTTGSNDVVVAVIDGGIDYTHEDLAANIYINEEELNGTEGRDDDGNGYIDDIYGYNFCTQSATVYPHQHGTHVAGTVAAVNNNGIGVCGVAGGDGTPGSGVKLLSCQVFDSRQGAGDGDFAEAIVYACEKGATLAQCSWGWADPGYYEQAVLDAIDYFTEAASSDNMTGGLMIFAAGNNGDTGDYYPACYDKVLSVGSMTSELTPASYSCYGDWVDIMAPGGDLTFNSSEGILSTLPSNQYGFNEGTSMACPHVSGIAALVLSKYGSPTFTNEALRTQLLSSINDFYGYGNNEDYRGLYGSGYIDAYKALQMGDGSAPEAVTDFTLQASQDYIVVNWTVPASSDNAVHSHIIYYSTEPFTAESDLSKIKSKVIDTQFLSSGENYSAEITGLEPLTDYYVALVAVNRWGNASGMSEVKNIRTNEGPKMTLNKTKVSITATAGSPVGQGTFTINNEASGILKWTSSKSSVSMSTTSVASRATTPVPGRLSKQVGKLGLRPNPSSASGLVSDDYERTDYPKDIKYYNAYYAVIGETDLSLPNSMAQLFYVDPAVYPDGFNLTSLVIDFTYGTNPVIEIYKGPQSLLTATKLADVTYSWFTSNSPIKLKEQINFKAGESFWVVVHFEGGQTGYSLPCAIYNEQYDFISTYSWMSNDMGQTWLSLKDALVGSSYQDVADHLTWGIYARSENPDFSELVVLTPSKGTVNPNESQEVTATVDGSKLINGTYKANITLSTNESGNSTVKLPVEFTVSGQTPSVTVPKIVDFGSLLVGETKTLTVEVFNEGYGAMRGSKWDPSIGSSKITSTSEHFTGPDYLDGGFPARSRVKFDVTYAPKASGSQSGYIVFKGENDYEFRVIVRGVATDPSKLGLNPSVVEADTLTVGDEPKEVTFNIVNEGNYPLEYVMPKFSDKTIEGNNSHTHKFGYSVSSNIEGYNCDPFEYSAPTALNNGTDIHSKFNDNVQVVGPISIGFSFPYYGERYDQIYITSFGAVCFAPNTLILREPMTPESTDIKGLGLISAYGRLCNFGANSKIEYGRQDGKFIINYSDVLGLAYDGMGQYTPISFRIVLSNNGDIEMFYDDYTASEMFQSGCTLFCGINDFEAKDYLEVTGADIALWRQWIDWGYIDRELTEENQRHTMFNDGTAVKFTAPKGNFVRTVDKPYGLINPGESVEVKATVSADNQLNAGETYNDITIVTNDPNPAYNGVRIKATIEGDELVSEACWEKDNILLGDVYRSSDVNVVLTLMNKGQRDMQMTGIRYDANKTALTLCEELQFPITIKAGESLDILAKIPTDNEGVAEGLIEAIINGEQYLPITTLANVIGCPTIDLSFTEVTETLNSGDPLHKDLVITNNGDEDTRYSVIPNSIARITLPENESAKTSYSYAINGDDPNVKFAWEDIETTGKGEFTGLATYLLTDFVVVDLPFEFPFYGQKYNTMYIYNTGFVSFTERTDEKIWPEPPAEFPEGTMYTNIIAPYWGLHSPYQTSTAGTYHYVGEDEIVVSWMEYANSVNFDVCFQLIMKKDGTFKFQYKGHSENAAIMAAYGVAGCSNEGASEGVRIPDYLIAFGKAVEFTPIVESTIAPGESETVGFDFVTNKMQGVYETNINIKSNVPRNEDINIPVSLSIKGVAAPVWPTDTVVEHTVGYYSTDYNNPLVQLGAMYDAPFNVENNGTAPFTIVGVDVESPMDEYESPYFMLCAYMDGYDWITGEPSKAWSMYYGEPLEVGEEPAQFSLPMLFEMEPGTYEIPIHIYYQLSADAEPQQYDFKITFNVTPAPYMILDKESIYAVAPEDTTIITETLMIGNAGEYKLTYDLVIDQSGVGEETGGGGAGGFEPLSTVKAKAAKKVNVAEMPQLVDLEGKAITGKSKMQPMEADVHQYDGPTNFEYNKALYYEHFGNAAYQYGTNNQFDTYKSATQYTAPAEGFNISHLYTALANTGITGYTVRFEIILGEDPDGEEVVGTATLKCGESEADGLGRFYVVELDKPVYMIGGEKFVVVATYDAGFEYPSYLCSKNDQVVEGRYQGWVESYGWFDLGVLFQDTYGSIGNIMSCLETVEGQPWVRLLSPASGTVEVEEIKEIQIELNAAAARLEKNNQAMLVIKSNDPMQPVINFPIILDCNGKPVIDAPTSTIATKEGSTTTVQVVVADPDGDDVIVSLTDAREIAKVESCDGATLNEDSTYTVDGEGVAIFNIALTPDYGTSGTGNSFTIDAVDVKGHKAYAVVNYEIAFTNRAPVASEAPEIKITANTTSGVYTYENFFEDPDGHAMSYTLTMPANDIAEAFTTSNGVIFNGLKPGTVNATLTATDSEGASTDLVMTVIVTEPSGVEDITANANATLTVMPNPVEDWLNAQCGFDAMGAEFALYATDGSIVLTHEADVAAGNVVRINASAVPAGLYLLVVNYDGQTVATRVIKR